MEQRERDALKRHIRELKLEHHDLDTAIRVLAERPDADQLQIARLKKRKLRLKDEINRMQSRLIPDLNA